MTSPLPRLLLLTVVCLFGSTRLCAALPPEPGASPESEPPSSPLSPPRPEDEPAAPFVAPVKMPVLPAGKRAPPSPAPVQKVAAGGILGRAVVGPDNQAVGRVIDVLVDAGSNPRAAVIDFGGFMGVGSRRIAVNWSDLNFPPVSPSGQSGSIRLDLTAEQIMSAPEYTDQTKPAAVVVPPPASSTLAKP